MFVEIADFFLINFMFDACATKKRDLSAMKESGLKFNTIIKFSFSVANRRNRTMLFCDLFVYLLPIHSENCTDVEKRFDFCFTALQHILGHFGRGQSP